MLMPATPTNKKADTMTVSSEGITTTITTISITTKVHPLLASINNMVRTVMELSHVAEVMIRKRTRRHFLISP